MIYLSLFIVPIAAKIGTLMPPEIPQMLLFSSGQNLPAFSAIFKLTADRPLSIPPGIFVRPIWPNFIKCLESVFYQIFSQFLWNVYLLKMQYIFIKWLISDIFSYLDEVAVINIRTVEISCWFDRWSVERESPRPAVYLFSVPLNILRSLWTRMNRAD